MSRKYTALRKGYTCIYEPKRSDTDETHIQMPSAAVVVYSFYHLYSWNCHTDTVFAVKETVKRGFDDFLLIGVVGARLDHTLGNVSILLYLHSLGKNAVIIDNYSEMQIVAEQPVYISERYAFFSLLNISGCAKGITIRGAKYPLQNGEITCEYQYGISNEVLPGQHAEVSVNDGRLLLIKVRA